MNMTDSVATGEREQFAHECAEDKARETIYEKLKDLFGVQGENLAFYLDRPQAPTGFEAEAFLRDLRKEYDRRVLANANRITEVALEG